MLKGKLTMQLFLYSLNKKNGIKFVEILKVIFIFNRFLNLDFNFIFDLKNYILL